jgi:Predicted dienelactone hydrolase
MSESYGDKRVKAALACAPGRSILSFSDESLAQIEVPVQIVVGGADRIAPVEECSAWLHKRLRASSLEILPDAGHYVFAPEAGGSAPPRRPGGLGGCTDGRSPGCP